MPTPASRPLALLLLALALAGLYLGVAAYLLDGELGFPLDDSWIHLVFARSLAQGAGLAYEPGQLVAGSTAPLWTALLAVLWWLPGPLIAWVHLTGVALFVAAVDATWRLARALGASPLLAGLAASWVALAEGMLWSAGSGMEIPLFLLLSLAGIRRHLLEQRSPAGEPGAEAAPSPASGRVADGEQSEVGRRGELGARAAGEQRSLPFGWLLLGLASLARPEGGLLLALAVVDALCAAARLDQSGAGSRWELPRRELRRIALGLGSALLPIAAVAAVHLAIWGSPFPTTLAVKAGPDSGVPSARYLLLVWGILFRSLPVATLLAPAGALVLCERLATPRSSGWLLPAWVFGLPLAYAVLSPAELAGSFGRYYFPLLPAVAVLAVLGIERLATRLAGDLVGRRIAALLVALAVLPTAAGALRGAARYAQSVANVADSDVLLGRLVARHLPPDALLAVQDVGAIRFFAPNPLLDLVGIVTPELMLRSRAAANAEDPRGQRAILALLEERRPELIVAFPGKRPPVLADARFPPLVELRVADNITMAEDRVVLYATPWTRAATMTGVVALAAELASGTAVTSPSTPPA